jgi:hypothetical protein
MSLKLTIEFETDNAAFDPDPRPECASILRKAMKDALISLEDSPSGEDIDGAPIRDSNGNKIGSFTLHTHFGEDDED